MIILEMSITDVRDGMILGKDIIGANGVALVSNGYIINESMIGKLKALGHQTLYIRLEDELSNQNAFTSNIFHMRYIHGVHNVKNIFQTISAGRKVKWSIINNEVELVWELINIDCNTMKYMEFDGNVKDVTYRHCLNVAILSGMLAKWMRLDQREIFMIIGAALLHDIGKLVIPNKILNKPGALTNHEYTTMKSHTTEGVRILGNNIIGIQTEVLMAVLLHHERIDGMGYPYGMSSDKIPVSAKIIGIADTFDAMISRRVYKNPMNLYDVIEVMLGSINQYDFAIMDEFFKQLASLIVSEDYHNGMRAYANEG